MFKIHLLHVVANSLGTLIHSLDRDTAGFVLLPTNLPAQVMSAFKYDIVLIRRRAFHVACILSKTNLQVNQHSAIIIQKVEIVSIFNSVY